MTLLDAPLPKPLTAIPVAASPVIDPEQRFAVTGVSWEAYVRLCDDIVHGRTRITYDQGRMEIVVVSNRHEWVKTVLARIIEAYADAVGIDIEGYGNTTMRREDLARGLEPDECYYVAHAAAMIGRAAEGRPFDFTVEPPPDLAIEVDISPPEVPKQSIYAALGVPELWRYDGRTVTYQALGTDRRYAPVERSLAFPNLSPGVGERAADDRPDPEPVGRRGRGAAAGRRRVTSSYRSSSAWRSTVTSKSADPVITRPVGTTACELLTNGVYVAPARPDQDLPPAAGQLGQGRVADGH